MTPKENMELIFAHKQPEWIPHLRHDCEVIFDSAIERPLFSSGRDAWGCNWISCPATLNITHPDTKDIKMEDLENWEEQVQIPDLDNVDFSDIKEQCRHFENRNDKMVEYISLNGIFERSHILMGFENALCSCMLEPEEYGRMLEAFADHKIRLFKKVYEIAQPDLLVYHDDMGTQASQFVDTEFFVKYVFPQYKRIVDAAKEIGYRHIVHHSCGRIEKLIPDWLACGFEGWDSVMPCNNLPEIKAKFGDKIIFMPGMDTQEILGNSSSTPEDIEKMVIRWMNMLASDGKGLILDSSVSYSLNPLNEKISLECILKHGKPFMDAKRAGKNYDV